MQWQAVYTAPPEAKSKQVKQVRRNRGTTHQSGARPRLPVMAPTVGIETGIGSVTPHSSECMT